MERIPSVIGDCLFLGEGDESWGGLPTAADPVPVPRLDLRFTGNRDSSIKHNIIIYYD